MSLFVFYRKRRLKVFSQVFFRKLAGSKGSALGRAPQSSKHFYLPKIRKGGRNFQWTFRPWETQLGGLPMDLHGKSIKNNISHIALKKRTAPSSKPPAIRFYSSCFFTYKYAFFSLPTRSKTPMEYSTFAAHCACICERRIAFASVFVVNGSGRSSGSKFK